MRDKIETMLMEFGITPNMTAFDYMTDATEYILKNGRVKLFYLYSVIAKKNYMSTSSVARSIRYVRERTAKMDEFKDKGLYLGTNSEFIYSFARLVRKELENEQHNSSRNYSR